MIPRTGSGTETSVIITAALDWWVVSMPTWSYQTASGEPAAPHEVPLRELCLLMANHGRSEPVVTEQARLAMALCVTYERPNSAPF